MTRLETSLFLFALAVVVALAAGAPTERLHRNVIAHISDLDDEDFNHRLHKRAPKDKFGIVFKKSVFKVGGKAKSSGTTAVFTGGGKKAAKGFGGLGSGFIRSGNDDGAGGAP